MVQIITTALAVLGAVLGVMNAWRNWVHDRVNVKVLVSGARHPAGSSGVSITVRNLSRFAVTVDGVSFLLPDKTHIPIQFVQAQFLHADSLPVRLEPRTAFTVFVQVSALPKNFGTAPVRAQCNTACGFVFRSKSAHPWYQYLVPAAV